MLEKTGSRGGMAALAIMLTASAAPAVPAQDDPASPAGQAYQIGSPGGDQAYRVVFHADGSISSGFNATLHPPRWPDGSGQWVQAEDGSVTITGRDIVLIDGGTGSAYCERWPQVGVGEGVVDNPCWLTGDDYSGPVYRVE